MLKNTVLGAAAALALVSGAANAQWIDGGNGNLSNQIDGELILTVWDSATERSFSQDLGVTTGDFLDGSAAAQAFTLDAAGVSFLGSTDLANVSWNVSGVSTTTGASPATAFDRFGYYFTSSAAVTVSDSANPSNFPAQAGLFTSYANDLGTADSGTAANPVFFLEGAADYAGNIQTWGSTVRQLTANSAIVGAATTASAGNGEAVSGWAVTLQNDFAGTNVNAYNTWTLDLTAGTLNYGATSEVPLPAAAWLFLSALLGMVGAARRRNA